MRQELGALTKSGKTLGDRSLYNTVCKKSTLLDSFYVVQHSSCQLVKSSYITWRTVQSGERTAELSWRLIPTTRGNLLLQIAPSPPPPPPPQSEVGILNALTHLELYCALTTQMHLFIENWMLVLFNRTLNMHSFIKGFFKQGYLVLCHTTFEHIILLFKKRIFL